MHIIEYITNIVKINDRSPYFPVFLIIQMRIILFTDSIQNIHMNIFYDEGS